VPWAWSVARQVLLIGADGNFQLDPVLWTLVHEPRFSWLLPMVIVLATKWDPRGGMLLLTAGSVLFGLQIGDRVVAGTRPGSEMLSALAYPALQAMVFFWMVMRVSLPRAISLSTGESVAAR
jgi:peptidoglycan/LPS O-acetylase OafA/YrhL